MQGFQVENILVFGKDKEPVTQDDLNKFQIHPSCQLHILRHYTDTPGAYRASLRGKDYVYYDTEKKSFVESVIQEKDIEDAFKTTGTKFFSDVAGIETPEDLMNIIQAEMKKQIEEDNLDWIVKDDFRITMFSFEYDSIVGEEDLIAIEDLAEADRARIKRVARGTHAGDATTYIYVIDGIEKKKTSRIAVEIADHAILPYFFMTAYPSRLGPAFPSEDQSEEERDYCRSFWEGHVFIV